MIAVYTQEDYAAFGSPLPGGGGGEGAPMSEDDLISSPREEGVSGETVGTVEEVEPSGPPPLPTQWPLALGKVRWVGEPVVAIVAESEAQGRDAAELIEIDYEELEAVTDVEAGSQPGAPLVWDGVADNISIKYARARGDADKAFSEAAHTIKQRIRSQRVVPMPLEGRATLAQPDPLTGGLTVWHSTQAPHWTRPDWPRSSACRKTWSASSRRRSAAASAPRSTSTPRTCWRRRWR